MKLLLFLLIVTVCGSLNKPPVQPCTEDLIVRYYYKGKYKGRADFVKFTAFDVIPMDLTVHARKTFTVKTDSIVIKYK